MTMQVSLKFKNFGPARFSLPSPVETKIFTALQERRLAVGMDYDRTMVRTDEPNRVFPPFISDESRVIEPTAALLMLEMPVGIFSGNKPSYLKSLCVDGLRAYLNEKDELAAISGLNIYSQNSTYLQVLDQGGEFQPGATDRYARQYLIPAEHVDRIETAFLGPLGQALAPTLMKEKPVIIRPEGTGEIHKAFGPIFEIRNGVSLSWIAVPGDLRRGVIYAARESLGDWTSRDAYRYEPGGQFSIDINHRWVAKNNGTEHFRKTRALSTLAYFGDSVYRKADHIGNDLPVIDDPEAIVFAVNPDQEEVPEHERVVRAGPTPDATRDWLIWLVANYIKVRLEAEHVPDGERRRMLGVLEKCDLDREIAIG